MDFYCHAAKLVIELDGSQHYEQHALAYDEERTRFLEAAGLRVVRFPNAVIERDFAAVCAVIDAETKARIDRRP